MSVQAASIQQYRGIKKRLRRAAKRTSPPTKTFVFYSRLHLRMNLAHDATVGERRMGNKKFPTRTKTYHGDVHLREGMSDLRTLVDRTAEALENAVDVVERPHVPRSAPRTIPRSVPRSSTERTAPPRSTHVQLDDVSHALIQQGERERLGKTPSSSSTTVWW